MILPVRVCQKALICEYSTMVSALVFQTRDVSSILIIRSKLNLNIMKKFILMLIVSLFTLTSCCDMYYDPRPVEVVYVPRPVHYEKRIVTIHQHIPPPHYRRR